jgi:hypothetical protein
MGKITEQKRGMRIKYTHGCAPIRRIFESRVFVTGVQQHLDQLVLMVDRQDSIIWREGETRNALFSVLRDLPSEVIIEI